MFEQTYPILKQAEQVAKAGSVNATLDTLRKLSLWEFGEFLFSLPSPEWPGLSAILPRMPSPDIQRSSTGGSGDQLLSATVDLVRIVHYYFAEVCFRSLSHIKFLDYWCGFGRFIRPMYYFTNPENIYGVDPWKGNVDLWRSDCLLGQLAQSDYLGLKHPLQEQSFDVICAFSSFLRTSARATAAGLIALRSHIAPAGLCIVATRPVEFWNAVAATADQRQLADEMVLRHRGDGFAFLPATQPLIVDGDSVLGNTSIAPEWIARHLPFWRVIRYDRGFDPMLALMIMVPQ